MKATKAPSSSAHVSGGWFGFFSNASSVLSPGGTGFHSLLSSDLVELSGGPPKAEEISWIDGTPRREDRAMKSDEGFVGGLVVFELWRREGCRRKSRRSCVAVAIKSRRATRVTLMLQISTRGSIPSLLDSRIGQAARGTEEVSRLESVNWTVPGRRESEGGRWKRTSGQEAIMDKTNKVEGYKESFVYYKKLKGKEDKTGWVMTEYSLHEGVHDELVLCYIRGKTEKKVEPKLVPKVENNILSNQVQDEEAGAGDAAQLA
ncbi:BnaA03g19110D [Brassica napus]|uniref:BnaA03g19110D protein n=2 Tax=Brassica TaxID=3705 RepID=A0A078EZT4_BRANA|nr:BnaA03g19110D [Brassica napus]